VHYVTKHLQQGDLPQVSSRFEFAQTMNPRRDAVLRSRNGSAPQPAATAENAATQNRWSELKSG
ncbi:hypothetical protein BMJ21_12220, partial [Sinorhizobium medicae]